MARKIIIKDGYETSSETKYRVMWKDEELAIHDKKFNTEEEAKEFYYSIDKPNRIRELDMIKECRFITLEWELL